MNRNRTTLSRFPAESSTGREAELLQLERRLIDGYARIEEASAAGAEVTEWETFWIRLLSEYEHLYDELERAA